MLTNLAAYLGERTYPGRGILLGRSADNKKAVIAYFIMGRSENSRNRVFETTDDGIRTKAYDESKMTDPSLIIYHPVRYMGPVMTVVTNGDQTDTIRDFIQQGHCYRHALLTRTFEPDGPNWTPRISGIIFKDGGYKLSILKADSEEEPRPLRYFYEYRQPRDGVARLIHTYKTDDRPLPPFEGEPEEFVIWGDIDSFTEKLWRSLDSENKVSLYVRYISADGSYEDRIVNKNKQGE